MLWELVIGASPGGLMAEMTAGVWASLWPGLGSGGRGHAGMPCAREQGRLWGGGG